MDKSYMMLLFVVHITYGQIIDGCLVTYTEQPPREFQCNPYATHLSPAEIFTRFGCRAESPVPLDNFMLTWYRESSTGTIEELGCPFRHIDTPTLQRCLLDILGETETASYWCVASYTIEGRVQTLKRSNVVEIERMSAYTGLPQCDGTIVEMVSTCADVGNTPVQTSQIISSSTSVTSSSSSQAFTNSPATLTTIIPKETNTIIIEQTTLPNHALSSPTPSIPPTSTISTTVTKETSTFTHDIQTELMSIVTVAQTVSIEGPQSTVTNSLSNDTIVFLLIAICAALLMGLITTIVALIIIVAVFRRKIKELQRSQAEVSLKTASALRTDTLESSMTHDKYVYPTIGIYSVPSRQESTISEDSGRMTSNSGRSSTEESYQSLMCANMEYTSIYTTTSLMKINSRETPNMKEV